MADYRSLKLGCLARGGLYEDTIFTATARSLYKESGQDVRWERPPNFAEDPKFFTKGNTGLDLDAGQSGSAFVSAVSLLADYPQFLHHVVPINQTFGGGYAGIFHFNLWCYGQWREVVIDDKLPLRSDGELLFCKSRNFPNEFWAALLEKAFAKVYGSYEALQNLRPQDILVDLTGGVGDVMDMRDGPSRVYFHIMRRFERTNTLMTCIMPGDDVNDTDVDVSRQYYHAYNITGLSHFGKKKVRGIRLKRIWASLTVDGRHHSCPLREERIDDAQKEDSEEFWMLFKEWARVFGEMIFVHFTQQSKLIHDSKQRWHMEGYRGSWKKDKNAGGSGNPPDEDAYWTNPQYRVIIKSSKNTTQNEEKEDDEGNEMADCPLVVSVIQRQKDNSQTCKALAIDIYKVMSDACKPSINSPYSSRVLQLQTRSDTYTIGREVTLRTLLPENTYCILVSTYYPHEEADFYLRVLTEARTYTWEMTDEQEIDQTPPSLLSPVHTSLDPFYRTSAKYLTKKEMTPPKEEPATVSALHLRDILLHSFQKHYPSHPRFSLETCRNLLAMRDTSRKGMLTKKEAMALWAEISRWEDAYISVAESIEESITPPQLKEIFQLVGYQIGKQPLSVLVARYRESNDEIRLSLDDCISCMARFSIAFDTFTRHVTRETKKVSLTLDQWMEEALHI